MAGGRMFFPQAIRVRRARPAARLLVCDHPRVPPISPNIATSAGRMTPLTRHEPVPRASRGPHELQAAVVLLALAAVAGGCQMSAPPGLRKVNDPKLETLPAVVTAPSEAKAAAQARAQINPRKNT